MKTFSLFVAALTLSFALTTGDALAAKRLGGGGSIGMQRQMSAPPAKAPTAAPAPAPAPSQAAPASAAAPKPAAAAPTPGRSWMGPIAGLAAGLGLAALASHFGFGEELASFMMMTLLAFVVIAAVGFFMRKRAGAQQPAMAGVHGGSAGMQYSAERMAPASRDFEKVGAGATATAVAAAGNIPADFDAAGFVRNAKVHFIRLQAANDARNLDDIREFTTPEMFAELKMNIDERGAAAQETDVLNIDAEVLEVIEESARYVASVRFTGQIREDNGTAETVDEIWHLVKPRAGQGGWRLAGIQQLQ